ncbi:major facilitator superfamily domain-containing protein 8 [Aethina tumida]|uniref:major facilitator superfamily domain-containing protein 8 n=1 Tax=Aethina tumida TaxID=116153 RepID=UPI002148953E|nr:major facilitator superfamily domain-containing protein 8 [Aethina tumida]XP_049821364.1 major facilitator superfamily domain-containing protein 8 [Aethina tumida]
MAWYEKVTKPIRGLLKLDEKPKINEGLETLQEYKDRWRSIYIIYFTMFLISLGFSIIVTGVWPYLNKLDPTAGKEFMGWVVAANPLGQMIFSPLVGWWSNRLGSIRIPLISSLIIFTVSSAMYSSLELFDNHRKYLMVFSRFLVGVSSANIAACRSYLSAATTVSERTKAVSMISLAQVLGFVIGPAIQVAVVPLGTDGVWLIKDKLKLDMYTASGWINVFLSVVNIYLFFPSMFKEFKIATKEAMKKSGTDNEKDTWKMYKPSYFAAWSLLVAFFVIVFNFMLLETLGTPVTMDQFAWSDSTSLKNMGILMCVGAVLAIATFASIAPLSKRYSEVTIMIWGGFLFMVLGRLTYIPFMNDPPQMFDNPLKVNLSLYCKLRDKNATFDIISQTVDLNYISTTLLNRNITFDVDVTDTNTLHAITLNCGDDLLGCPSTQEWCTYTPAMTLTQFILGYILTAFGYPIGVTLIQTLFSKVLGPRPQGVWMGLMTGSGCLSRVMGPVFVTFIYEEYGTVWTFSLTTVMMAVCLLWLLLFANKLLPKDSFNVDEEEGRELKEVGKFVSVALDEQQETEPLKTIES